MVVKRNMAMPIALIGGAVFSRWMGYLSFLSPYLIFLMLFITYCRLSLKQLKPEKFEVKLLLIQLALSAGVYFALFAFDHVTAEGVFICVFAPTATAAPVVTSMLGGRIHKVVSYSLISNLMVAAAGPPVLALIGDGKEISFLTSFLLILREVVPLLLAPMLCAILLQYLAPKLHDKVANHQELSFGIWVVSLFIIVGGCVSFAINTWEPDKTLTMIYLTVGAGAVCLIQYKIGRRFGKRYGDAVSGAQSLMQKNTVLAVWLAMTYMNPLASIGPAAYILFQNIVNSWQIARHDSMKNFEMKAR
ncbi:MAG: transporter [Muribaculaceae bacterium]|nr:transporter [Muribaculaceae bacterium]